MRRRHNPGCPCCKPGETPEPLSPPCGLCALPINGLRFAGTFNVPTTGTFDRILTRSKPHQSPLVDNTGGKMPVRHNLGGGGGGTVVHTTIENYWMAECLGPAIFFGTLNYMHMILQCINDVWNVRWWFDSAFSDCEPPTRASNVVLHNGDYWMPTGRIGTNMAVVVGSGTCDPLNLSFVGSAPAGATTMSLNATLTAV